MFKFVFVMMYFIVFIFWLIVIFFDKIFGKDYGIVYKKSGLKILVILYKNLGDMFQCLNQDEVIIISVVLDLKEKLVVNVMIFMVDVFVMVEDIVLDEKIMDMIFLVGYLCIFIYEIGNFINFVGMFLVKILIIYDFEDVKFVKDFLFVILFEIWFEISCLDIVNFFQEGKFYMVFVLEYFGEDYGVLGVVIFEDVIEEFIGEEIIDEFDVYIDVYKVICCFQFVFKVCV